MRQHTDQGYEQELQQLREKILLMGAQVESMVAGSMRAFESRNGDLACRTLELDQEIDRCEMEIDGFCVSLLARRQPVASDLRFVTTSLKLVTDLERMGDLAVNICERVIELQSNPEPRDFPHLTRMAETVQGMVRDALDAFVGVDPAKAQWVIERDRSVDASYAQIFQELLVAMMEDRHLVQRCMGIQAIAKHLERIGDHATNLAEMVIFMAQGRDVRHLEKKESAPE